MKKISLLTIILTLSLFFTSCGAVPEKVQDDINSANNQSKIESDNKIENSLTNIEEIFNNTPKTADLKFNNITFKGNVDVANTSKLYKLSVTPNVSWFDNSKETVKEFFGGTGNLEENIIGGGEDDDNLGYYRNITYENEEQFYVGVSNIGTISTNNHGNYVNCDGKEWGIYHNTFASPLKIYDDLENFPNDIYKFYDGELSIADGYKKFKSEFERFIPFLPENQTMDLKYISVYQYPEKDYFQFYIEGTVNYKNVPFNHINIFGQNSKEYNNFSFLYSGYQGNIMLSQKDPFISEIQRNFIVLDELEQYDKILSFDNAWDILCEKAAKNRETNISSAELVYLIYFEDTNSYGNDWYMKTTELPKFYAKPVWCFAERGENAQKNAVFYIDAITGEMTSHYPYVVID